MNFSKGILDFIRTAVAPTFEKRQAVVTPQAPSTQIPPTIAKPTVGGYVGGTFSRDTTTPDRMMYRPNAQQNNLLPSVMNPNGQYNNTIDPNSWNTMANLYNNKKKLGLDQLIAKSYMDQMMGQGQQLPNFTGQTNRDTVLSGLQNSYNQNNQKQPSFMDWYTKYQVPNVGVPTVQAFAKGGLGRLVNGEGDGREDKIPAKLSDGEYVIDAETVALLGNGSTKAGAHKLDSFRKNLRMAKGGALSKGRFSPAAKNVEEYMNG